MGIDLKLGALLNEALHYTIQGHLCLVIRSLFDSLDLTHVVGDPDDLGLIRLLGVLHTTNGHCSVIVRLELVELVGFLIDDSVTQLRNHI